MFFLRIICHCTENSHCLLLCVMPCFCPPCKQLQHHPCWEVSLSKTSINETDVENQEVAVPFCCCQTSSFPGAVLDLCQYTKADNTVSLHLWDWFFYLQVSNSFLKGCNCSCCVGCCGMALAAEGMLFLCSGILLHSVCLLFGWCWATRSWTLEGRTAFLRLCLCRLLIWVPQAVVDHKKIQHQVHRRRSLQEVALVKDAWDICFRVYSNELLLLHASSPSY